MRKGLLPAWINWRVWRPVSIEGMMLLLDENEVGENTGDGMRMAAAVDAMVRAGPLPRILQVKDAVLVCRFFYR